MAPLRSFLTSVVALGANLALTECAVTPAPHQQFSPASCEVEGPHRSLESSLHGDFRIAISDSVSLPGRHPILIHLAPASTSPNDSAPAHFDVRLPFVGSIIGDSLISLNKRPGHPTVAVGKRAGNIVIVVDALNPYIGPAFEFTVTKSGSNGFTGTWLRTRSGQMNYQVGTQAFDMGPFCAKRLNASLDADAPAVYRAVLDSLFAGTQRDLPVAISADLLRDSASGSKQPVLLESLALNRPTLIITDSVRWRLEVEGRPLVDSALMMRPMQEIAPFWLALRRQYWPPGVTQLGTVHFNANHTDASVGLRHFCGTDCYSAEIDRLSLQNDEWKVRERRLIPALSREGMHFLSLQYLGPNKRPDNPPEVYGRDPAASLPRRMTVRVTDSITSLPLAGYDVRAYSPFQPYTVRDTTNRLGEVVLIQPPFGQLPLMVRCPRIEHRVGGELLDLGRRPEPYVRPGIDTVVTVAVNSKLCTGVTGFVRLDTAEASSGKSLHAGYPSGEAADVYRAAFRAMRTDSSPGTLLLLAPTTSHACTFRDNCGSLQLYRLEREGKVNAGTVRAFKSEAARRSPIDPRFWTNGPAAVMTDSQRKHLDSLATRFADVDEQGNALSRLWAEVKHAFPGADKRFSATRVGFSPDGREALVEISQDTLAGGETPELMLLRKSARGWSVTRRHIERETTSGEWKNNSCEPVSPSTPTPNLADLKSMRGIYELTSVSTHPDWAGRRYKAILSLWGKESAVDARDYSMNRMNGLTYSLSDKKHSPKGAGAVRISGRPGAVAITLGPQSMCFDCEESVLWVHGKTSTTFSGTLETIYGFAFPPNDLGEPTKDGGYFCAKRITTEPFERFPTEVEKRSIRQKAVKAVLPRPPIISYLDSGQRRVVFQVQDTAGRPLAGAVVQLKSDSSSAVITGQLEFSGSVETLTFANVNEGMHVAIVRRIGYATVNVPFRAGPRTTRISVRLVVPWVPCEFCVVVPPKR